ncbi:flagellar operon protein [Paenibacillus phyllosphaerae]|uniref:Flagellar operon protein n=1 Tax=Paenibacillus phyllosphaerae TaxID=274593 RepID=A0A7W5AW81_9BACL|nr:TIGR02530 family flagellar biosynthesis protein [Paenibacillus phyllosphaerae]MBB3109396.1 flagellar operon protein [Paenibacillus phyllosphaerae]
MSDTLSIGQLRLTGATPRTLGKSLYNQQTGAGSFQDVLNQNVLKFSQHAETRMKQRGISFGPDTINKIEGAIDQAAAKGAKDSLVIYNDVAMIVNVPSRTVVTAMDGGSLKGNVFTKIDSAVIIP